MIALAVFIEELPDPIRCIGIAGDLSDREKVLVGLDINEVEG